MRGHMYVQWASTGILFDPIHRASNHTLEWFLSFPTYSSAHRPRNTRCVASEVDKTGGSVSIFNILPFRRKPLFDIDTLYREQAGMVARRIRRFVRAEDVEEVLHEVFLKAFERRESFRGTHRPLPGFTILRQITVSIAFVTENIGSNLWPKIAICHG